MPHDCNQITTEARTAAERPFAESRGHADGRRNRVQAEGDFRVLLGSLGSALLCRPTLLLQRRWYRRADGAGEEEMKAIDAIQNALLFIEATHGHRDGGIFCDLAAAHQAIVFGSVSADYELNAADYHHAVSRVGAEGCMDPFAEEDTTDV